MVYGHGFLANLQGEMKRWERVSVVSKGFQSTSHKQVLFRYILYSIGNVVLVHLGTLLNRCKFVCNQLMVMATG